MVLATISGWGGPIFLGVSTQEFLDKPIEVIAGRTTEFVVTLSSNGIETPLLNGDLSVTAGGLAAPLASDVSFQLQRIGEARAGVQRFKFSLDLPETKQKQDFILKMKVRSKPSDDWLPLPTATLSAIPFTWKESIRLFTRQFPSGRLGGSEKFLLLFQQLGIEMVESPDAETASDQSVLVWFADDSGAEFQLPPAVRTVTVIFKKNVRGGLELWRPTPQSPPCVVVETGILDRLDSDPEAQETFERALSMVRALIPAPPAPPQSP